MTDSMQEYFLRFDKGQLMKVSKILTAAAAAATLLGASSAIAATSAQPVAAKLSVASIQSLRASGIKKSVKNNASNTLVVVGGLALLGGATAIAITTGDSVSP